MPEGLLIALLSLVGTALVTAGAVLGHLLSARAQSRAAKVQADAAEGTRENALIDQLQEELGRYRTSSDARAIEQDRRMTSLEDRNGLLVERNDRYRDLLHKHRAHIWDQLPPPPPDWPDDLPR